MSTMVTAPVGVKSVQWVKTLKPEILQKTWILRKLLYSMDEIEAMEFILDKMKSTKTNLDFFDMMRRGG